MALAVSTRETDITGWHRDKIALGVIFTALNGTSRQETRAAISGKIQKLLSESLVPADVQGTEISFHFFPEKEEDGGNQVESGRILYADRDSEQISKKFFSIVKRIIDVSVSALALAFLSPLFVLIAIAVKKSSAGPVFFRQRRLGKHGVEFTFLKFRSMYAANDSRIHQEFTANLINGKSNGANGVYKILKDPRITPLGSFLRASSLDELPQLLNVLGGSMSLVGPRPPIPYEFECYQLWHRRRILEAKPGITGLWQVNGRSRTTFDEMVRMDLQYIKEQSLWTDIKILIKTPLAVISGHGAY
jgi:lipopolysaccharide/colanic/teichoic acid biosynthesis glycosyltransferase